MKTINKESIKVQYVQRIHTLCVSSAADIYPDLQVV
ncbi:hypothetical protein C5167_044629 [Papaver somniferum]|uniref:Uncharacterized protein n=1 Tax=Papaver somniferum TaxID=3469 RepID=A0A4Y7LAN6_PAPSO|nr:hypothetical protein C5167_044629 [Papaver somniferum]